jgi:VanZ family protein
MRDAAARWGPPIALMAVIFALSAQPSLNSGLGIWDTILRKLAHMTEFGLLSLLWWRALGRPHRVAAVAIALAYAATDEYHQTFVAGRHGSPVDWGIDAAGIALANLAWTVRERRRSRHPAKD